VYFFKNLKIDRILNILLNIEDMNNYSYNMKFIELVINILSNITIYLTNQKITHNLDSLNNEEILSCEESYREKVVLLCYNSLKTSLQNLKDIVNQSYFTTGKKFGCKKASQLSQSFLEPNLDQSFTNTYDQHFQKGNTRKTFNLNNMNDGDSSISTFKGVIKKLISLLSITFSTINDADKPEKIKKLGDYLNNIIELFTDYRMLLTLEPSLNICLQHFIFNTRHILVKLGDNNNYKIIYLCLNISWPQYEFEVWKLFTESFNLKFKKTEVEKNKLRESLVSSNNDFTGGKRPKSIKNQYINYLCDMNVIYLIENSTNNKILVKILNSVFKGQTQREEIILYLLKW